MECFAQSKISKIKYMLSWLKNEEKISGTMETKTAYAKSYAKLIKINNGEFDQYELF